MAYQLCEKLLAFIVQDFVLGSRLYCLADPSQRIFCLRLNPSELLTVCYNLPKQELVGRLRLFFVVEHREPAQHELHLIVAHRLRVTELRQAAQGVINTCVRLAFFSFEQVSVLLDVQGDVHHFLQTSEFSGWRSHRQAP